MRADRGVVSGAPPPRWICARASGANWRAQRSPRKSSRPVTLNGMPVIRAVSLVLAHVPSLVRLGSKPLRVLREVKEPIDYLRPHLRDWNAARAYAPNQVFIGNVSVDELASRPVPWHRHPVADADRFGPDGEIMSEDEFLGLLATCDGFDLLALTGEVADRARSTLDAHPVVGRAAGPPGAPA